MMEVIHGISILDRTAVGRLLIWHRDDIPLVKQSHLSPQEEEKRFARAQKTAWGQLSTLIHKAREEAGSESAAILEVHQMLLEDEDYEDAVRASIAQGATAEYAAWAAGEKFSAQFAAMDTAYMQARGADVLDVARRLVQILTHTQHSPLQAGEPFILAADDLSPSETIQLDKDLLLGFVTRQGSPTSHTAILARTMGIPALMGVEIRPEWHGREAVLDGREGRLYLDPTPQLRARMEDRRRQELEQTRQLLSLKGLPDVTLDGTKVDVCANIGSLADLALALEQDARGVGLFRSEFLYLHRDQCPGEEEQFQIYRQAAQAMTGRRVVIRTMDIGGDKQAPYLHLEREANPALGYRAIRISLTRRELLDQQLRAILRAAAFGHVCVMFPMIISVDEVRRAKAALEECRQALNREGIPTGPLEVGIMVETPAAAIMADQLAREVDFFSLGTNDLTQYTLAIDRQDPRLAAFYDPHHPAVLRMIGRTVREGHRYGCWVGVCGELAADLTLTETFLRMGVDELSVSPGAVLSLRRRIRSLDLSQEKALPELSFDL